MGRIVLEKVTKSFGNTEVIPPLDLTIEEGEFVVFVGPSGCGKSTLLRLIAGLEDVTSGAITIDDVDSTNLAPAKRGLAMVFQSYALYPHMTVRKNIAFPLKMAGLSKSEQEDRVARAAEVLNLSDYLDRRPGQLSGGQRQRVAIGRAIVREPSAPRNTFVAGFIGSPKMNFVTGATAEAYGASTIGIRPEHIDV
ncbi:MAG: ABC transporter ATP-binding protein, partial [Rhodobacteraceae bacterium]|nr:ABC transporter ATP-binding protein [Paracoccaceae bacterium]